MPLSTSSLERLVPDRLSERDVTGRETLELHLARYRFAAEHARPGRLLDIACGVGYGTRLLADARPELREVVGVDLDAEAVAYARERYAGDRVRFAQGDATHWQEAEGFDTVVSLETVEHVEDPAALIAHLASLLRPGGVLVASVPTTPSVDVNPHHRHDFTESSFRALFAPHGLRELARLPQVQPFGLGAVLGRREERLSDLRPALLRWYLRHPRAAVRRAAATLRYGLTNRYLTLALRADPARP